MCNQNVDKEKQKTTGAIWISDQVPETFDSEGFETLEWTELSKAATEKVDGGLTK